MRAIWRWTKIVLATLFVVFVGASTWVAFVIKRELDRAAERLPRLPQIMADILKNPTVITASDGTVLFQMQAEYRRPVLIRDVPQVVIDATIAAEDIRFYQHDGIDLKAIARAVVTNFREKRLAQGASTITMQLAKRIYNDGAPTFQRKLEDMAMAYTIERSFTKDQILEMYLNEVFYGSGAYGIQAAADVYFGKKLSELTLDEAALLARLVRRPSQENPFVDPEAAVRNRNIVLDLMLEAGFIDAEQHREAVARPLKLRERPVVGASAFKRAPFFVDYVLARVREELPGADLSQGGYRVETTLDWELQRAAEQAVAKLLDAHRRNLVTTAAFLLMDRDGRILAYVGGGNYRRNQFDAISQGRRQPGSAFKPFVYAAAFESGVLSPVGVVSNAPFVWRDPASGRVWSPRNSSGGAGGLVSVRRALAASLNLPAVHAIEQVGPRTVVSMCRNAFGIRSPLDPVLALGLGASAISPMEMAEGYSVFMTHGDRVRPFGIARIIGPDGSIVRSFRPEIRRRVMSRENAEAVDRLLRAVVTSGTGRSARSVVNARGKTGTTDDNRDAWFVGYTNELLGVGWVANETRGSRGWRYEPMARRVFGGTVPIGMWVDVVSLAQKKRGEKSVVIDDLGSAAREGAEAAEEREATPPPTPPIGDGSRPEDWVLPPLEPAPPPAGKASPPTAPDRGPGAEEGATGTVMVEVCAETGRRATVYCPERVVRPFARGKEPKTTCTKHLPPP